MLLHFYVTTHTVQSCILFTLWRISSTLSVNYSFQFYFFWIPRHYILEYNKAKGVGYIHKEKQLTVFCSRCSFSKGQSLSLFPLAYVWRQSLRWWSHYCEANLLSPCRGWPRVVFNTHRHSTVAMGSRQEDLLPITVSGLEGEATNSAIIGVLFSLVRTSGLKQNSCCVKSCLSWLFSATEIFTTWQTLKFPKSECSCRSGK